MTSTIEFEQEVNLPPTILDVPGSDTPIGSIIKLDLENRMAKELAIEVNIRDENISDELHAQHRLVSVSGAVRTDDNDKIPSSGSTLRSYKLVIPGGAITNPGECYRLELVVSSEFFDRPDAPFGFAVDLNDVAKATWWIWETSGDPLAAEDTAALLANSCQAVDAPEQGAMIAEDLP